MALKAYEMTAKYDDAINDFMRKQFSSGANQLTLKYGMNSHQKHAQIFNSRGKLPFTGKYSFLK